MLHSVCSVFLLFLSLNDVASILANAGASERSCDTPASSYICDNSALGDFYPFCINVPGDLVVNDSVQRRNNDHHRGYPLLLYLPGSGADIDHPSQEDLMTHTSFDGVGLLLAHYRAGNTSDVVKLVAEKFISVIPVSPATNPFNASQPMKHYWPDKVQNLLEHVASLYPVDDRRIYCTGYSKGSRGIWRFNTAYPDICAASINDAGGAESPDGQYMIPQTGFDPYPATFPLLNKVVNNYILAWDGSKDTTAGTTIPRATQAELVRLGSNRSSLVEFDTDHEGLQTLPWTTHPFRWLLAHHLPAPASSSQERSSIPEGRRTRALARHMGHGQFGLSGSSAFH